MDEELADAFERIEALEDELAAAHADYDKLSARVQLVAAKKWQHESQRASESSARSENGASHSGSAGTDVEEVEAAEVEAVEAAAALHEVGVGPGSPGASKRGSAGVDADAAPHDVSKLSDQAKALERQSADIDHSAAGVPHDVAGLSDQVQSLEQQCAVLLNQLSAAKIENEAQQADMHLLESQVQLLQGCRLEDNDLQARVSELEGEAGILKDHLAESDALKVQLREEQELMAAEVEHLRAQLAQATQHQQQRSEAMAPPGDAEPSLAVQRSVRASAAAEDLPEMSPGVGSSATAESQQNEGAGGGGSRQAELAALHLRLQHLEDERWQLLGRLAAQGDLLAQLEAVQDRWAERSACMK